MGHRVQVYTSTANGKTELEVLPGGSYLVDGVQVIYFARITGDHTHISPALWQHLWKNVAQYEVVHIHCWWNFLVLGAVAVCWLKGVRPILSTRGMLSEYSFSHKNSFKKRILHTILGKFLLKQTYLHTTTQRERQDCLRIFPNWEGFVAPNIIKLPDHDYVRRPNQVFTIGILARIDPVKNIETLLLALSKVPFSFRLQIAGVGDPQYMDELKHLTHDLGIAQSVDWVGWVGGEAKYAFLANLDLLALTSHTENFANVIIESLVVGTAVLVSQEVGLSDTIRQWQWGWVTELGVDHIADHLVAAHEASNERERIRQSAPSEIKQVFDAQKLAQEYLDSYQSVVRKKIICPRQTHFAKKISI